MEIGNIGSDFDDFLENEGIKDDVEIVATRKVFIFLFQKKMDRNNITARKIKEKTGINIDEYNGQKSFTKDVIEKLMNM